MLAYKITLVSVDSYLQEGHDVIIDKAILNDDETLNELVRVGERNNAEVYEFILTASKEVVLERAERRGFNPAGLLTPEGVEHLWNLSQDLKNVRLNAVVIDTSTVSPKEVYERVKAIAISVGTTYDK
jgi:RNase adaptor protein for sRNA GlmZ degradation